MEPTHTTPWATLRWQLTTTHLIVTAGTIIVLQALSVVLVIAGLVATGQPLGSSVAAVAPALPGLLILSALLFLAGGSVTALLYGQLVSRPHVSHLLAKLGLENRTQAVVLALRERLVAINDVGSVDA